MKSILTTNASDLALVIGNGINQYNSPAGTNSWKGLLTELARIYIDPAHAKIPTGVSPTEFFDILELAVGKSSGSSTLQSSFCRLMANWTPLPQHSIITKWAKERSIPILTTNFEGTLGAASFSKVRRFRKEKFTAFYPWSSYYAPSDIHNPLIEFAIWHINGMQTYRQSVRLGLTHYMGSVERARSWLHKSGTRLFNATEIQNWPGSRTWLHIFIHKPLLFFGIGLGENEVFLRWLLIERAKYYRKFPLRAKKGWYVYTRKDGIDPGKELFLRGVGIEPCEVSEYSDIYESKIWS